MTDRESADDAVAPSGRLNAGDLVAGECPAGHLTCPPHERCPVCGVEQTDTLDLTARTGTVLTWTTNTATPPGVRSPNHLAIVAFEIDGRSVRSVGQLTTVEVETEDGSRQIEIGDEVDPVPAEQLREPGAGIREPASQRWDGYRFEPL